MNNQKMGEGIRWYENAAYWITNFFCFGALWITKIIIKKAVVEAIGKVNFTIVVDNKGKTIEIKNITN